MRTPERCPAGHLLTRLTDRVYVCRDQPGTHTWVWRWTGSGYLTGESGRTTEDLARALLAAGVDRATSDEGEGNGS